MKTLNYFLLFIFAFLGTNLFAINNSQTKIETENLTIALDTNIQYTSDTLIKLGIYNYEEGKYKEALEYFNRVNPNDYNFIHSQYDMSLTYAADNQPEKAIEILESIDKTSLKLDKLSYYNLYGSILDIVNRKEEAIQLYESIYEKYKTTARLPYNYALTYFNLGNFEKAREILEYNVRLFPYHFNSHKLLGDINYAQGRLIQIGRAHV